jgi:hypothetical protein
MKRIRSALPPGPHKVRLELAEQSKFLSAERAPAECDVAHLSRLRAWFLFQFPESFTHGEE